MRIAYPLLNEALEIAEDKIMVLNIENPSAYRKAIFSLISQCGGYEGDFVLSENNIPIDFSKNVEFISDVFFLDFSEKKLLTQLSKEAGKVAGDMIEDVTEIMRRINDIGFRIASEMDESINYSSVTDIASIVKLLDIHIDCDEMTLPEKILEYMKLYRRFFGKKLFVILNLKPCLSYDELELLYKSVVYEKFNVLLIENHEASSHKEYERVVTLDVDLCQI